MRPPPSGSDPPAGSAAGDHAFRRYVLPEVEVLLRVARTLTRHDADAEDLVQDTLLRAHRAIDRFDGRHPRAWLLTILRNANVNRTRRRRPELLADPDRGVTQIAPGPGPDEAAVGGMVDGRIVAALDALPDRFRRVVDLVDLDGLTYEQASEVLDVPVGTVMSRLHRARRRMRAHLAEAGVTTAEDAR